MIIKHCDKHCMLSGDQSIGVTVRIVIIPTPAIKQARQIFSSEDFPGFSQHFPSCIAEDQTFLN